MRAGQKVGGSSQPASSHSPCATSAFASEVSQRASHISASTPSSAGTAFRAAGRRAARKLGNETQAALALPHHGQLAARNSSSHMREAGTLTSDECPPAALAFRRPPTSAHPPVPLLIAGQ